MEENNKVESKYSLTPKNIKKAITRRRFFDILTVVTFIIVVWPIFAGYFYVGGYDTSTIPDEVKELDERISEYMSGMDSNFQDLYEHPDNSMNLDFVYGSDFLEPLSPVLNYRESVESMVYISTEDDFGSYLGAGSVLTEDGVILTNHHVIDGAKKVTVATYNGTIYEVEKVLAYDKDLDVIFLKIGAEGLKPIPIGDPSLIEVGEETIVIGHSEQLLYTLSTGIVSGIRGYESQGGGVQFQITNPISGGNSGGALINKYGEIIGVPSWAIEYENNSVQVQNLNFAVPIGDALSILD